ncbi:hypothetical protein [Petrachloros mirabilis]
MIVQATATAAARSHRAAVRGRLAYEKAVIVTRATQLEELVARFATVPQARFYLEHAGQDFAPIEAAHNAYHAVVDGVREALPHGLKHHVISRDTLPQYTFSESDLVITIGPDGLVVNVAKYLDGQPIVAVNPDPDHIDGILLPFALAGIDKILSQTARNEIPIQPITMAAAYLSDGQELLAFNDFFVGARSHVSARYRLHHQGRSEDQSSSGIIISTGAGSTGWLQSVYAGAAGVIAALGGQVIPPANGGRLPWDTDHLIYTVREPFPSKVTGTSLVFGVITRESPLVIDSNMAQNGVVFSDGMETDYAAFTAGLTVTVGLAKQQARLVVLAP